MNPRAVLAEDEPLLRELLAAAWPELAVVALADELDPSMFWQVHRGSGRPLLAVTNRGGACLTATTIWLS